MSEKMVDRYYARIKIGGPIPQALVPKLAEVIGSEGLLDMNYEEVVFDTPAELANHLQDGVLYFQDWHAVYGMFDCLEPFLQEHGIPFDRHSGSYPGLNSENVYYRPGMTELLVRTCDALPNLCEYVPRADVASLLESKDLAQVHAGIREIVGDEIPPLLQIDPQVFLKGGEG